MEIIEKEKIKEVPAGYYEDRYCCNNNNRRDVNGKANAGLTLGIIGTALGAWALFGNRRSGLLGGAGGGLGSGLGGANININGLETGISSANGVNAPTAFQAWEKGCENALDLQAGIYSLAMNYQNNRYADRQQIDSELFGLYKTQVDADFGLYKSTRDGFDILNAKQNQDAFNLYKSQRDSDDDIRKELSDLKAQVAINAAVRPYQDKLIQCEIAAAKCQAAFNDERIINYVDRLDCKNIKGVLCLPETPTVTGYLGNPCACGLALYGNREAATPTTPTVQ